MVRLHFGELQSRLEDLKRSRVKELRSSEALRSYQEFCTSVNYADDMEREKRKLDDKWDRGRYVYLIKRSQLYKDLIGEVDSRIAQMEAVKKESVKSREACLTIRQDCNQIIEKQVSELVHETITLDELLITAEAKSSPLQILSTNAVSALYRMRPDQSFVRFRNSSSKSIPTYQAPKNCKYVQLPKETVVVLGGALPGQPYLAQACKFAIRPYHGFVKSEIKPMHTARVDFGCFAVHRDSTACGDSTIYVVGGKTSAFGFTDKCERYLDSRNDWQELPSLPIPISRNSVIAHKQRLFSFGGRNIMHQIFDTVFVLDLHTLIAWCPLSSGMPVPACDVGLI